MSLNCSKPFSAQYGEYATGKFRTQESSLTNQSKPIVWIYIIKIAVTNSIGRYDHNPKYI